MESAGVAPVCCQVHPVSGNCRSGLKLKRGYDMIHPRKRQHCYISPTTRQFHLLLHGLCKIPAKKIVVSGCITLEENGRTGTTHSLQPHFTPAQS